MVSETTERSEAPARSPARIAEEPESAEPTNKPPEGTAVVLSGGARC